MKLYLVQHGDAFTEQEDPQRALSPKGCGDIRRLSEELQLRRVSPERIRHSGKRRAEQSAQLLVEVGNLRISAEQMAGLAPMDPVEETAKRVCEWVEDSMLVGHQPFMGRLVSFLLTGESDGMRVGFVPGAAVCLELDTDGAWQLVWMSPPLP